MTESSYPVIHRRWGGFAEELLHHTSRYYHYTEAFLRNLTGRRDFSLAGYGPERLTATQRKLLVAILSQPPTAASGRDVLAIIEAVKAGLEVVDEGLLERYRDGMALLPHEISHPYYLSFHEHTPPPDLPPLDPFLTLARRLRIPASVHGHHVEVPLRLLAEQLDSPVEQVRANLQEAVNWLHEAGYRLHNNPDLTFEDATGGRHGGRP